MAQAAVKTVQKQAATQTAPKTPVWKWEAKNKQGEVRSGEMEAQDDGAVRARLGQMGLEPTKVKKKAAEFHLPLPSFGGVSSKDILVFTRQFSVMIDAGLPLGIDVVLSLIHI